MQNYNFRAIAGAVMVLVYAGVAFMLAFTTLFNASIESATARYIVAALLFLYAVYRAYRLAVTLKFEKEENNE
jgi:uncharacterized membrane protein YjjP (DUF1212 family)